MQIDRNYDQIKKKPSTSNQKTPAEQDGLTGSFPPITQSGDNNMNEAIDELQQRIKDLEEINEKLLQERMELDRDLSMLTEEMDRVKLASRGLEQNLIEKVDLARSLQDLSDERKEDLEKLTKLYE